MSTDLHHLASEHVGSELVKGNSFGDHWSKKGQGAEGAA